MKEIKILKLQGKGLSVLVKGFKSKRERDFVIRAIEKFSSIYRMFYKIRKSVC